MFVFSHWTYSSFQKKRFNVEKYCLSLLPTRIKSYPFTGVCVAVRNHLQVRFMRGTADVEV